MEIRTEKKDHLTVLHLTGEATIASAAALKSAMIETLETADALTVSLDAVSVMDVSCLQLLCACNRSAEKKGKKMNLTEGNNGDTLRAFLIEAGYDPEGSCPENPCKRCLWKGDRR
jgi:anti-anti-sigma factor